MPQILLYLEKLSVSLAVVFLFYQVVLRKLTFYTWNRYYLLIYSALSFIIPFIDISPFVNSAGHPGAKVLQWVPLLSNENAKIVESSSAPVNGWFLLMLAIGTGVLVMAARLLLQYLSFLKMKKKAIPLKGYPGNVLTVDGKVMPFSFGNYIFVNPLLHSENELQEIILHEFIHVKEKHSMDIIWMECVLMLNWFNPFAWLLRSAVRQNLEFIADSRVISYGVNRKDYQYLLLKVVGNNQFSIASQFSFSSLKKRIAMMNKMKTARLHLVRFLFVLPILAVLLLSFRKYQASWEIKTSRIEARDTIPAMQGKLFQNKKGNYIIFEGKHDPMVIVLDKDKKEIGRLKLSKWDEASETKFGELPPPPPPPAPGMPPPPPPAKGTVFNERISDICTEWDISTNAAVLTLKNGNKEKYDLTNPEEKAAFEKKYGNLISIDQKIASVQPVIASLTTVKADPAMAPVALVSAVVSPTAAIAPSLVSTTIPSVSANTVVSLNGTTIVAPVAPIAGVPVDEALTYVITGKEDIVITITKKTTRAELEDFIKQMKEKNVDLSFDDIEYNSKAELVNISGTMKSTDGHSNFVASDFSMLVLAMVRKDGRTYFKVSVRDKKDVI
jgi:hypothetical protein